MEIQFYFLAESTRNGNDRKTYDQIHRCSPIGNINNNNSNNNNNSASPIDASRKTFDETFSEDRPVNKDEVPEKNENEGIGFTAISFDKTTAKSFCNSCFHNNLVAVNRKKKAQCRFYSNFFLQNRFQ